MNLKKPDSEIIQQNRLLRQSVFSGNAGGHKAHTRSAASSLSLVGSMAEAQTKEATKSKQTSKGAFLGTLADKHSTRPGSRHREPGQEEREAKSKLPADSSRIKHMKAGGQS